MAPKTKTRRQCQAFANLEPNQVLFQWHHRQPYKIKLSDSDKLLTCYK